MSPKKTREVALPEGLESIEVPEMTQEQRDKLVAEFRQKQQERFQKRLADRVERFSQKLTDKSATERQVLVRRILIDNLKAEVKERKEAIASLKAEIREIRPKRKRRTKEEAAA